MPVRYLRDYLGSGRSMFQCLLAVARLAIVLQPVAVTKNKIQSEIKE